MNLSDDAKKIYELNFSVVKSIVAMLFVAHGTGLVTLFATDAVKYRTPLFILGIGFMCLISLIMLSYVFFVFMIHSKTRSVYMSFHKLSNTMTLFAILIPVATILSSLHFIFKIIA